MRVLHVLTRFVKGGTERDVAHAIEWERRHGMDVELAVGPESEVPASLGVRTHVVPTLCRAPRPHSDVAAGLALRALAIANDYDVVHSHHAKAGALARLFLPREARAARVHWVTAPSFGAGYAPLASTLYRRLELACGRRTDLFACVSDELARIYAAAGVAERRRFVVVRSPVDVDAIARARVQSASGPPTVLVVGALDETKRPLLVVDRLRERLAAGRVRLVFAGTGPLEQAVRQRAERLGVSSAVVLRGYVEDVPALFASGRVLVHASTKEGLPQVYVQALAAGLPIVATAPVGLADLPAGADATRAALDGSDLAAHVERALERPATRLPLDALDAWRPASVAAQTAALYRRLGLAPALEDAA